jgi:peptidoglycan/LPS O-acetylase OafA/YrhL
VTSVIVLHAGFGQGGWLGVDVFFVLSGFLIASLLLVDTERQVLRRFYERRFRRLLPVFLVCVAVVSALVMLNVIRVAALPGRPLHQGFWSSLYVGNWYEVFSGATYWGNFSRSPLDHLWSLSIEEQYYVAFPLLLWGLRRLRLSLRGTTLVLGVLTVVAGAWTATTALRGWSIDRIYFGTDTRVFALLIGATAALLTAHPRTRAWLDRHRGGVAVTGALAFAALVAVNVVVDGSSPRLYAGWLQLVGVAEVLVVVSIVAGNALLSPLLAHPLLVWVGRRSYSIYLWHLPVFVLLSEHGANRWLVLVLGSAAAFALSDVTFRWVERPFQLWRIPRRRFALATACCIASLAAALWWATPRFEHTDRLLHVADGPPPRLDGRDLAAAARAGQSLAEAAPTTIPPVQRLMVMPDSAALTFSRTYRLPGIQIIEGGQIGCGVVNYDKILFNGKWAPRVPACQQFRTTTWPALMQQADAALWLYSSWDLGDLQVGGRRLNVGTPEYAAYLSADIGGYLDQLTTGNRRVFLGSALCYSNDNGGYDRKTWRAEQVNGVLKQLAATRPNVTYLPLMDFLCVAGKPVTINGAVVRPDDVHFDPELSGMVWQWIYPYLRGTKTAGDPAGKITG